MKFVILLAVALFGTSNALACGQGRIPNSNQICIEPSYIEGCVQYLTNDTCQTCGFNYQKNQSGRCEYILNNSEQCCLNYNSSQQCTKCNVGLFLIDDKCKQLKQIGCLEQNSNGKCINCASDYVLDKNKCVKGIKGCVKYLNNNKNQCIQCKANFSLVNNNCLQNTILGCKTQENLLCKECYDPFTLKEGHCQIQNCKGYNDFGCTACNCGYFINQNRVCQIIAPGCLRYQRGYCTDCMPNFKLKGNICDLDGCQTINGIKCQKCKQGYQLNTYAICTMKNCLQWNNEKCEICKQSYHQDNGKCVKDAELLLN